MSVILMCAYEGGGAHGVHRGRGARGMLGYVSTGKSYTVPLPAPAVFDNFHYPHTK